MPERLRSDMWSAETLITGVKTVGQQPTAELLASNDPELLHELKVFGCQNFLVGSTSEKHIYSIVLSILFDGESVSNLGYSPLKV